MCTSDKWITFTFLSARNVPHERDVTLCYNSLYQDDVMTGKVQPDKPDQICEFHLNAGDCGKTYWDNVCAKTCGVCD